MTSKSAIIYCDNNVLYVVLSRADDVQWETFLVTFLSNDI